MLTRPPCSSLYTLVEPVDNALKHLVAVTAGYQVMPRAIDHQELLVAAADATVEPFNSLERNTGTLLFARC